SGIFGSGIMNDASSGGSATLTVVNSTICSNSAFGGGGGLRNDGNPGGQATATLINCTVSGNVANNGGGGILNLAGGGSATLHIDNSTFSGNRDSSGGDTIVNASGSTIQIGSTILDVDVPGTNFVGNSGTITSDGYNLSSDSGGGFLKTTGDQTNT